MNGVPYLASQHDSPLWEEVSDETARAERKFGRQLHLGDLGWFAILAEEVGEAAKDVVQREVPPVGKHRGLVELRAEIVQIASTAVRWLDAIDSRDGGME